MHCYKFAVQFQLKSIQAYLLPLVQGVTKSIHFLQSRKYGIRRDFLKILFQWGENSLLLKCYYNRTLNFPFLKYKIKLH